VAACNYHNDLDIKGFYFKVGEKRKKEKREKREGVREREEQEKGRERVNPGR